MLRTTILHAFTIDTVIVGSNGSHHPWSYISWWCVQAKLSSIHTNVTLNSVVFSHYYQYHNIQYEPAIALINKKIQNIISISPNHRHLVLSAVTLGVNQGQH